MQSIQNGINYMQTYYANMPNDIAREAAKGAIISVAWSLIFDRGSKVALLFGTMAATATLVEAIIRPIMNNIFQYQNAGHYVSIVFSISATLAIGYLVLPTFNIASVAIISLGNIWINRNSLSLHTARLIVI